MKRKKYAEELEARLSDDEVKVIVKAKKTNTSSKESGHQLFVVSISADIDIAGSQKLWVTHNYLNKQSQVEHFSRLPNKKNILYKMNQSTEICFFRVHLQNNRCNIEKLQMSWGSPASFFHSYRKMLKHQICF